MNKYDKHPDGWRFTSDDGSFALCNPHQTSYLYFPLVSEKGLVSAITPTLHGDIKTSSMHEEWNASRN